MTITVHNRLDGVAELALGLVVVDGVRILATAPTAELDGPRPSWHEALDDAVAECVARRARPLDARDDAWRKACRDMLRNGRYKPTGRGKPASEYLLRSATRDAFPRVYDAVDALNLVSLTHLTPISLWDRDKAARAVAGDDDGGDGAARWEQRYEVRLGGDDERYVFNSAGQTLDLTDLVVGCARDGERSVPLWNSVKDSMASKIDVGTTRVGACIFAPASAAEHGRDLAAITEELRRWLVRAVAPAVSGASSDEVCVDVAACSATAIARPGEEVTLALGAPDDGQGASR